MLMVGKCDRCNKKGTLMRKSFDELWLCNDCVSKNYKEDNK